MTGNLCILTSQTFSQMDVILHIKLGVSTFNHSKDRTGSHM